ncbi:MAG: hypothetical protein H7Y13_16865 [Sphingobacteriaceae bacterium]|nr:hypothetical protein [Sphingobacteriaceae bacterium]
MSFVKKPSPSWSSWSYPIIAFVFNYILYKSFPAASSSDVIAALFTIPFIAIVSVILTFIHKRLKKGNHRTVFFQIFGSIFILLFSIGLFVSDEDNKPAFVIKRMRAIENGYVPISLNDYFLDRHPPNLEKIVAAEKKFYKQLTDTAYAIWVSSRKIDGRYIKTYGIMFTGNGDPITTNPNLKIEKKVKDGFNFIEIINNDTLRFTVNRHTENNIDTSTVYPNGPVLDAWVHQIERDNNVDNKFWAYGLFHYFL